MRRRWMTCIAIEKSILRRGWGASAGFAPEGQDSKGPKTAMAVASLLRSVICRPLAKTILQLDTHSAHLRSLVRGHDQTHFALNQRPTAASTTPAAPLCGRATCLIIPVSDASCRAM